MEFIKFHSAAINQGEQNLGINGVALRRHSLSSDMTLWWNAELDESFWKKWNLNRDWKQDVQAGKELGIEKEECPGEKIIFESIDARKSIIC